MSQEIPKSIKQWTVKNGGEFDSLKLSDVDIPQPGDNEVLVKLHAASLNFRDLAIAKGMYPFPVANEIVPGSDGAGVVVAVGSQVNRFKKGDKVVTLFNQEHLGGSLDARSFRSGLGGTLNGALREYGAFDQNGLVPMPKGLTFNEASTLSCSALTSWNALFGLADKKVAPGQWVLTQGTGGVSISAIQFAKAAGARVIATTSSPERAKLLEKLGADHILNYKETADWGIKAKEITGGAGVDHVIEVAGPTSMEQSLNAVKIDGVITIIGFVGGQLKEKAEPSFLQALSNLCIVRGIFVGSRVQFEEMCAAVEANLEKLRPVVDEKTFKLDQLKEAYEYQWSGKHQSKVVVEIA